MSHEQVLRRAKQMFAHANESQPEQTDCRQNISNMAACEAFLVETCKQPLHLEFNSQRRRCHKALQVYSKVLLVPCQNSAANKKNRKKRAQKLAADKFLYRPTKVRPLQLSSCLDNSVYSPSQYADKCYLKLIFWAFAVCVSLRHLSLMQTCCSSQQNLFLIRVNMYLIDKLVTDDTGCVISIVFAAFQPRLHGWSQGTVRWNPAFFNEDFSIDTNAAQSLKQNGVLTESAQHDNVNRFTKPFQICSVLARLLAETLGQETGEIFRQTLSFVMLSSFWSHSELISTPTHPYWLEMLNDLALVKVKYQDELKSIEMYLWVYLHEAATPCMSCWRMNACFRHSEQRDFSSQQ